MIKQPTYVELLDEIARLKRLLEIAKDDVEYWHMRAVEAEDDRDRFAAKLDQLGIDDVDD